MSRFDRAVGAAALATLISACSDVGDPRPQLLIVIDTDLPTSGQVLADGSLSRDAAIDTVRVDAIPIDGADPYDLRSFPAPEADDWPLSFGVAAAELEDTTTLRFRVRLFQGRFATTGISNGRATVDPLPQVAVDRLVEVPTPTTGVLTVSVLMSGDCVGDPVRFAIDGPPTTCIDGDRREGAPTEGLVVGEGVEPTQTRVGSWPRAREVACPGPPRDGAVCIPGGFFVLGDTRFVAVDEFGTKDSVPLRPVVLSPFFMDETELSLWRLRAMVDAGYDGAMPAPQDDPGIQDGAFCTFHEDFSADPQLPVNCITQVTAAEMCAFAGGTLPSEAQWEHAARGRGQRRTYPWGEEQAICCAASLSRSGPAGNATECPGDGVEPVGSHPPSDTCGGIGDMSRDGVLDLAGSVSEALRDDFANLDDPCWAPPEGAGILVDPVCDSGAINIGMRGGYWNSGSAFAATPWRGFYGAGPSAGVRCVYEVSP